MLPSLRPLVHDALHRTAVSVDVGLIRLALAASRRKARRLRELSERHDYYVRMAEQYGAFDPMEFYVKPEAIAPAREKVLEKIPGGAIVDLQWQSGYEPRLASVRDDYLRWRINETARVRLLRHDRGAEAAIIWIHGYRGGPLRIEQRICRGLELYEAGFDVAIYTMPFHGARAPFTSSMRAPLFPSQGNIARTNEGFGQVIWELRGLMGWLRGRTSHAVGVAGMSLGGYCTSLLGTVDPDVSFLIPFIPLADFTDAVVAHETLRGIFIDEKLQEASRRALEINRPLARPAVVPGDRVLVIGAEADRITGRVHAERLARHFRSEIAWFRGGHILQYGREAGFRALRGFATRHSSAPPPMDMAQAS